MVKGKAVNNKQEATHPPMIRRSRKRGYPVEKITKDDNQDFGQANTEDTLVPCHQALEEESDKNELSSIPDGNTSEKNEDSETPKVTTASLKRQLVVSLSDCGDESNLNKTKEPQKVLNECEPDYSNKSIDVNAGIMPNCSEEQMSAVDSDTKIETNQEFDEVKQISIEPVVEGSAKKRRRMGMCRSSEKEQSLFLPKCGNRAEENEKQNANTVVAKEEKGCIVEVLLPQQQMLEIMQHLNAESHQNNKDDREEIKEETAAFWTTMVCERLSTEMHVSEDDPKGGLYSEHILKTHTHEKGIKRTEPGCQMTVVPIHGSRFNVCKSENTKDSDQSLGNHHCEEKDLIRGRTEGQGKTLDNLCKHHTEPDLIQASAQQPVTERQQNKTETEAHLTVSVCDASSPNKENWETAQKPHLDKEKQSETEVHLTATLSNVADSVCEPQNPEFQTTKVHSDGSPEPEKTAALLNDRKPMNEQEEPQKEVEATFTKILKHENKYAVRDHNHSEYSNIKINMTEEAPVEQEPLYQLDTYDKTSLENLSQIIGENTHVIHTSVSNTAPETYCSSINNNHMVESNCEEKEPHDIDSSTVNVGPPESREYVSDSQLNTIDMTDQVMNDGSRVSPECYEDVTDLVDGLIRELSSLNRTVMATHRELENLRRRGKNSRNTCR